MASANLAGETSFGGAALEWRIPLGAGGNWSFDPHFGVVVHDGDPLRNPFPPSQSVDRARFDAEELALGSRDLFRLGFGVTWRATEDWNVQFAFEHLSHGQILGDGVNQGLDNAGVKIGRRF